MSKTETHPVMSKYWAEKLKAMEQEQQLMLNIFDELTEPINYIDLGYIFDERFTGSKPFIKAIPSAICRRAFWTLVDQGKLDFTPDRRIILGSKGDP
jgi:hypothetical protein